MNTFNQGAGLPLQKLIDFIGIGIIKLNNISARSSLVGIAGSYLTVRC
jgi:hypothetical protein